MEIKIQEYQKPIRQQGINFLELEKLIKDPKILEFITLSLEEYAPFTFFTLPASSSGKYHPEYALGVGGLLKHTKASMIIAQELFPLYPQVERSSDLIMAALALHDIGKPDSLHPLRVKEFLEPLKAKYYGFDTIIFLIESHMGQWDLNGKLPRPQTPEQHFVHLCDYLASRKAIAQINLILS